MKCLVTGASGFVGSNLVHELNAQGHEVLALIRESADLKGLEKADYTAIQGDFSDRTALEKSMRGCDWVFHVGASYHLWMKDYKPMYTANVDGTGNVLEAAWNAGCSRIVYTSTVGCIGLPKRDNGQWKPADETASTTEAQMSNHYKLSKYKAEQLALSLASSGAPIVIVNPSAPIGPLDVKPTPTGQVIVDFLKRKMPAYMDTGLNWVHVRDVARGHILAAEKGRVGERYILGNKVGNWSMKKAFSVMEEVTGIPAPKFKVPYPVAWIAAVFDEALSSCTSKPPKAPIAGVRMAKHKMYFDPSKAIKELGLPQTPPEQAIQDAIKWFMDHGYVKR